MAFKKLVPVATGGTHAEADASLVDVLVPTTPLSDSTSNMVRAAAWGFGGYVFANKKHTGNFF